MNQSKLAWWSTQAKPSQLVFRQAWAVWLGSPTTLGSSNGESNWIYICYNIRYYLLLQHEYEPWYYICLRNSERLARVPGIAATKCILGLDQGNHMHLLYYINSPLKSYKENKNMQMFEKNLPKMSPQTNAIVDLIFDC